MCLFVKVDMDILRAELEKKKRQLEESNLVVSIVTAN